MSHTLNKMCSSENVDSSSTAGRHLGITHLLSLTVTISCCIFIVQTIVSDFTGRNDPTLIVPYIHFAEEMGEGRGGKGRGGNKFFKTILQLDSLIAWNSGGDVFLHCYRSSHPKVGSFTRNDDLHKATSDDEAEAQKSGANFVRMEMEMQSNSR